MTETSWLRNVLIIQGGMGVAVSNHALARAVSLTGQLGTVSLVALPHVVARRLQCGDEKMLRALAAFPVKEWAEEIVAKYWQTPSAIPVYTLRPSSALLRLTTFAAFAEVWLAKDGHSGKVAGNLLEKVQAPMLPTILGALWAGVDALIVGAGLAVQIPEVLDALCGNQKAEYRLNVTAHDGSAAKMILDPQKLLSSVSENSQRRVSQLAVRRPAFLPIVSLDVAARALWGKTNGRLEGFVIEDPRIAGGHNPSPRGWRGEMNDTGEPIYSERDIVDLEKIKSYGVPFWIAGGKASPEALADALSHGATGIQCGSIYALSQESGMLPSYKSAIIKQAYSGKLVVRSDPRASPTGFPFQVVQMSGTLSDPDVYAGRRRVCNMGYLREPVVIDGVTQWRCPAEPEEDFVRKKGPLEHTVGRKCLCNGLLATIGLGMGSRDEQQSLEPAIVTLGQKVDFVTKLTADPEGSYSVGDVMGYLLGN